MNATAAAASSSAHSDVVSSSSGSAIHPQSQLWFLSPWDEELAWFASAVPLGSVVEARDTEEDWCVAVVVGESRDAGVLRRYVRVHYAGWDTTADDWISVADGRVMPLGANLTLVNKPAAAQAASPQGAR